MTAYQNKFMRDETKQLRPWLESWGAWRRLQLNISYPIDSVSCNPDLHIAKPIIEPLFKMPSISYNPRLSVLENANIYRKRLYEHERLLREYHHIKRAETKAQRRGIVPDYNPQWRMNLIDRRIQELSEREREVILLRYEKELKVQEIPELINRTLDTVKKRLQNAHNHLLSIPRLMVSHGTPIRERWNYTLKPRKCNNEYKSF